MIDARTFTTPAGDLTVLTAPSQRADDEADRAQPADQVVIAAGFTDAVALMARLGGDRRHAALDTDADLGPIGEAIERYLGGVVEALDDIPVEQPGTELQQQVWDGLRDIPAGETRTYTQLAAATDRPRAIRAAGTACGRNLVAPIIPCHRALRTDGSLGGYYYGLDVKRWLLAHEAASD